MKKQRKITELIGRVVELKSDNKRYLVMPLELKENALQEILGTIKGRISCSDIVYKDKVVLMPLDEIPEQRLERDKSFIEGKDFIVRNIRPEDIEQVKILNESMSKVLFSTKKLYRNLTEIKELEQKKLVLEKKIDKIKATNLDILSKYSNLTNNSYLLELTKDEIETLNAKKKLQDKNRPLYRTSLSGESNATRKEALELLKVTNKPLYHRFGFAYKGAETNLITRDEAINKWLENSFIDMHECVDKIIVNEYRPNDIH